MTSFKVPHKQTITGIIYSCILTIGGITVDSKTKREFASGRDWVFSTHFQLLLLGIWLDAGCSYKEPWLWSWLLLEATHDHASPKGRSFSFWGGLKQWFPSPAVTFTNISTAACSPTSPIPSSNCPQSRGSLPLCDTDTINHPATLPCYSFRLCPKSKVVKTLPSICCWVSLSSHEPCFPSRCGSLGHKGFMILTRSSLFPFY